MKKAELQYNKIVNEEHPEFSISSFNVEKTLLHLVEVINEMQEEIHGKVDHEED